MNKPSLRLFAILLLAFLVPGRTPAAAAVPEDAAAKVTRLADAYVAAQLARLPEQATLFGVPGAADDQLSDNSLPALKAWQAREDAWRTELASVDGSSLWGRPEWVTYGFLREALEASIAARIARQELWSVSHFSGWQTQLPQLASIQPVGSAAARDKALARWRRMPHYIDTEIVNLKEGLRLGFSSPRPIVDLVIVQLDAVLAMPVRTSPLFAPAQKDKTPEFQAAWERLLTAELNPAIKRYRDFLKNEYRPKARTSLGMSGLPGGKAAYQALFRQATSLDRPVEETYKLGEQAVARNVGQAAEIGRQLYGGAELAAVIKKMAADPNNHFKSREELLDFSKKAVERARLAMPAWFALIPKAQVVIEPIPGFLEKTASAHYEPAAADGSRPGVYGINLYQPENQTKANAEVTAFHETYPGHHFQISVSAEQKGRHPIALIVGSSSYIEGWARYTEALAEEMGLYTTEFGRINRRLWPAHGMVVDPGLHVLGWSRERAVRYILDTARFSAHEAESLVDRIIATPTQLTTYDTGGLEFIALRAKAEQALGKKFDIKAFHTEVLRYGAVTLPMLREIVDRWIASYSK